MAVTEKKKRKFLRVLIIIFMVLLAVFLVFHRQIISWFSPTMSAKPVIYLYPEQTLSVNVQLGFDTENTGLTTYPQYNGGWNVTARPDGIIVNQADGKEYSYLFWEANNHLKWDYDSGFLVKGCDTAKFLQEKLAYLGLTPKEYNEFIVYWLPKMEKNEYNLIHFAGEEYTSTYPLQVVPHPDSMLRVFMVYKAATGKEQIQPQHLQPFVRKGFSVVEWGGTELS